MVKERSGVGDVIGISERRAFRDVSDVAGEFGASVHLHTKLSDLADPTGLGNDFDWATRAHVDLLLRDEGLKPLVAVEVDGKQHTHDPEQARRDRIKDDLLRAAGIDVLRVGSAAVLNRHGRRRLAGYLTQLWFTSTAFYEAQARGEVSEFEDFFHPFAFETDEATGGLRSMDPSMGFLARIMNDSKTGVPITGTTQVWMRNHDPVGIAEALVMLPLTQELFLLSRAEASLTMIAGVAPSQIAEEIALLQMEYDYERFLSGEATARRVEQLDVLLPRHVSSGRDAGEWYVRSTGGPVMTWLVEALGEDRAQSLMAGH